MSAAPYTKAELKKLAHEYAEAYMEVYEAEKELKEIEKRKAARNVAIAQCDEKIAASDAIIAQADKKLKELDAQKKLVAEQRQAINADKKALWVKCFLITFGQSLPEKASEIDQIFTEFAFSTSFEVQDRNQFTIKSVTPFVQYLNKHSEVTQLDFRAFMRINDANSFMKGLSDRLQQNNKVTKIIFDGGLKSTITGKIAHITPVFSKPANQQQANANTAQSSTAPIQIPAAPPKVAFKPFVQAKLSNTTAEKKVAIGSARGNAGQVVSLPVKDSSTAAKSLSDSESLSLSTSSDEETSPPSSPERTNNFQKYSQIQLDEAAKKAQSFFQIKNILIDEKPIWPIFGIYLLDHPDTGFSELKVYLKTLMSKGHVIKW